MHKDIGIKRGWIESEWLQAIKQYLFENGSYAKISLHLHENQWLLGTRIAAYLGLFSISKASHAKGKNKIFLYCIGWKLIFHSTKSSELPETLLWFRKLAQRHIMNGIDVNTFRIVDKSIA